jgi:opacity protein-like surface antigen
MKKIVSYFVFGLILFSSVITFAQIPLGANINTGIRLTTGDFRKQYKDNYCLGGEVFYKTRLPGLDLTLSYTYGSYVYRNSYLFDLIKEKSGAYLAMSNFNWFIDNSSVMIGGKYKILPEGSTPYVSGEIGMNFAKINKRLNGNNLNCNTNGNLTLFRNLDSCSVKASESGFGFALGAGVLIPLIPHLDLDMGVRYTYSKILISKATDIIISENKKLSVPELNSLSHFTLKVGISMYL